jgi:hypothetical protein
MSQCQCCMRCRHGRLIPTVDTLAVVCHQPDALRRAVGTGGGPGDLIHCSLFLDHGEPQGTWTANSALDGFVTSCFGTPHMPPQFKCTHYCRWYEVPVALSDDA